MLIIGCDSHTRYQQIAMAEESTSELLLERAGGRHVRLKRIWVPSIRAKALSKDTSSLQCPESTA